MFKLIKTRILIAMNLFKKNPFLFRVDKPFKSKRYFTHVSNKKELKIKIKNQYFFVKI